MTPFSNPLIRDFYMNVAWSYYIEFKRLVIPVNIFNMLTIFSMFQKWTDWNSLRFWKLMLQKNISYHQAYLILLQYNNFTFSQL